MWPVCAFLLWLPPQPDCKLTATEAQLIMHYIAWSAEKEGLAFADSSSETLRLRAVRSVPTLYVDLPLRRRRLNPPPPANLDLEKSIVIVNPETLPPVYVYSWNPGVFQESFDSYLKERAIQSSGRTCTVRLPDRIEAWRPSPPDADKALLLRAMANEAGEVIPGDGKWWLSVADFNTEDPYVDAVITDANTGQHIFGTFALNRRHSALVGFDRLRATDIERITSQEFVGSNPITVAVDARRTPKQ